jgi:diguanylate cyclase (GGDEF)-like protein
MMPGLEGPQVCKRVRSRSDRSYIYILLLSARTQKGDLLGGLESGADDYLTKPFDARELNARLQIGQRILDLQQSLIATREKLSYQATHDALTGIANRSAVLDAMSHELSRQVREKGSFGVILIDLDHFKNINDTYGHLCGDDVLEEAARRMVSCVRPYDTVGRYGGEKFLLVAPSSDDIGTMGLATRIREAICSIPFDTKVGPLSVTASFGAVISRTEPHLDSQALLHLADEALYRAKNLGRNRAELSTSAGLAVSSLPAANLTANKSW